MANDGGDFSRSMSIAASGLRAQAGRMRVISENIANAEFDGADRRRRSYRRKIPTFSSELDRSLDARVVTLGKVRTGPVGLPRQVRARPSGGRRQRQRQISQRQFAGRNDRHARGAAILRGQPQHHHRHAADDPAHPRHPQGLIQERADPWLRHPLPPMPMRASPRSSIVGGAGKGRRDRRRGPSFGSMLKDSLGSVIEPAGSPTPRPSRWRPARPMSWTWSRRSPRPRSRSSTLVSVRDRVIQSYEEIMRMPI